MSFFEIAIVGLGGFVGALLRYLISQRFNTGRKWPVGTFLANSVGSFFIGLIFGLDLDRIMLFFLASGLLGALTTFSTLHKECIEIWKLGRRKVAIAYISSTYIISIIAAIIGYSI